VFPDLFMQRCSSQVQCSRVRPFLAQNNNKVKQMY
jgi:hypothetical protein